MQEEDERNDMDILLPPPKHMDATLETYIKRIRMDVKHHPSNLQVRSYKHNLPSKERKVSTVFAKEQVVIKPTDKGSVV